MTKAKHTPWCAKMTSADWRLILDTQGRAVALPYTDDAMHAIVRAVNSHAALIEALENIQANLTGRDNFAERIADSLRRIDEAVRQAREV